MEGIAHFRRRKCIVIKLSHLKTTNSDDIEKRESFSVNGIQMDLEFGKEVNLLEPVYNALKTNVRVDHQFKTIVDPETGEATQKDIATEVHQYQVTELEDWKWPKGHSPYDENGNCIRHDLTDKELEEAPMNEKYKAKQEKKEKKYSKVKMEQAAEITA